MSNSINASNSESGQAELDLVIEIPKEVCWNRMCSTHIYRNNLTDANVMTTLSTETRNEYL